MKQYEIQPQASGYYGDYERPPTDREWKNMGQETLKSFGKETLLGLGDLPQDIADAFRNFSKLPHTNEGKK